VEKVIEVKALLGLPEELEVIDGEVTEKVITITAVSTQTAHGVNFGIKWADSWQWRR
jgi:hypothetical protein